MPPPVAPRPQLPSSLRPQLLSTLDKRLAQIAIASFQAHFSFVVYSGAMERLKPAAIEEIPERFVKMLVPKRSSRQAADASQDEAKKADDKKADEKRKRPKSPQTTSQRRSPKGRRSRCGGCPCR